jgi:hypothetical protein
MMHFLLDFLDALKNLSFHFPYYEILQEKKKKITADVTFFLDIF